MDAGVSSAKSILAKPLKLLTEDDISQLTREDCRSFLKEKGMRRPSWNKSQAIQQVLSLKALLEPGEDSSAGILRKILVSQPGNPTRVTTTSIEPTNEYGAARRIPFPEDDSSCHLRDSPRSAEFSGGSGQNLVENEGYKRLSPRSSAETSAVVGQMTIFYSGKVNVYDGVPSEKARSIMHYAASPIDLPENDMLGGNTALCSLPPHLLNVADDCSLFASGNMITKPRSKDIEGQSSRKVSLQRYREKRKDRRFLKAKKTPAVPSSSLEMFLNRQPRVNTALSPNLGGSGGSGSSPPQPGDIQAQIYSDSPENQTISPNLSVDLNNEDT